MNLGSLKIITREITTRKEIIVALFAVAIFLYVSYIVFLNDKIAEQNVPNYAELSKDSWVKYKEYMISTNNSVEKLAGNNQLEEVEYYKDLIDEREYEERSNPFAKPF